MSSNLGDVKITGDVLNATASGGNGGSSELTYADIEKVRKQVQDVKYIGFARESGWGVMLRGEYGESILRRVALELSRTSDGRFISLRTQNKLRKPTRAEWRKVVSV